MRQLMLNQTEAYISRLLTERLRQRLLFLERKRKKLMCLEIFENVQPPEGGLWEWKS